eukprot:m.93505 g.93505  ORF g.93505 m.93505 type:complete len:690 (-) comp20302_c1_seq1:137-2206(-)
MWCAPPVGRLASGHSAFQARHAVVSRHMQMHLASIGRGGCTHTAVAQSPHHHHRPVGARELSPARRRFTWQAHAARRPTGAVGSGAAGCVLRRTCTSNGRGGGVEGWDAAAVVTYLTASPAVSPATVMRILSAGIDGAGLVALDAADFERIGVKSEAQQSAVRAAHSAVAAETTSEEKPSNSDGGGVEGWDAVAVAACLVASPEVSRETVMQILSAEIDGASLVALDTAGFIRIGVTSDVQQRAVRAAHSAVAAETTVAVETTVAAETTVAGEKLKNTSLHAMLSPSASERWLKCPPSAKFEAEYAHFDDFSGAAQQGVFAHAVAATRLSHAFGQLDPADYASESAQHRDSSWFTDELSEHVDAYVEWAVAQADARPVKRVELAVRMDRWVPDGWGTADLVLASDTAIHVVDFKYGKVQVAPEYNTQLMLYALGAVQTIGLEWVPATTTVQTSIYQPRAPTPLGSHTLMLGELMDWAEETVLPKARQAFEGVGEFLPGKHCRYCTVRPLCRSRGAAAATAWHGGAPNSATAVTPTAPLPPATSLSHARLTEVLESLPLAKKWLFEVAIYARAVDPTRPLVVASPNTLGHTETAEVRRLAPALTEWLGDVSHYARTIGHKNAPKLVTRNRAQPDRHQLSKNIMVTSAATMSAPRQVPRPKSAPRSVTQAHAQPDRQLSENTMVIPPRPKV